MSIELFSKPNPSYRDLVQQLYGKEIGEGLYRRYEAELDSSLWKHRLEWFGIGLRGEGRLQAHAIVQLIKDKPLVYVGYVEAMPNRTLGEALTQAVLGQLTKERSKPIYLPVNLSVWHACRFKSFGDEPLPFEPYSQPYYAGLFEGLFPEKEIYSSCRFDLPHLTSSPARYSIRQFSPEHFSRDLPTVYELSAEIFRDAHSVPSFEEFRGIYGGAVGTLDPRYMLFAEEEGKAVGFIYAIRQGPSVYIKTFGVLPEFHRRGAGSILFESICRTAAQDGCEKIYGLMMRNDRLITQLLPAGAERVAEYVLYKGE
jgi:GNAT superfamily N-acetyltransferase